MDVTRSAERHIQVGRHPGRRLRVLTEIVEIKLTGADTGGAYSLVEIQSPPQGGASALHTHPPQETFLVLEGTYEMRGIGPEGVYTVRAEAGDVVHIAAGLPHSYQNVGESSGRLLAIFEPPGRMIDFFEAYHAEIASDDPIHAPLEALPDLERTLALFARFELGGVPEPE